jgi:uncharacterized protein (DUF1810 family)
MTQPADAFDLARFVRAHEGAYGTALAEIRSGRKRSHWMWYVFPQLAGLGCSAMSQRYAIRGAAEVRAYFAHPVLGPRLIECAQGVLGIKERSAHAIFGSPRRPEAAIVCDAVRGCCAAGLRVRPGARPVLRRGARSEHAGGAVAHLR